MDYPESLEWLYARQGLGIKLGLDKVERLLAAVGDPQRSFRSVHVAGTNGKGTVVRLLVEALRRAGHRTGCYTSPHLVRFTERILVDGDEVAREDVARILTGLRPVVEGFADDEAPTFFEVATALAFLHFQQQGVTWAVVETGLGGRLDATNVLTPDLTIITNVARDHTALLGDSPEQVATEKAGIMKPGVPCITGATGAPLQVLKTHSQALRVPMSILGEDYHVLPDVNGLRLAHPAGEAHYTVAAAGAHQLDNAALVVAAADALRQAGVTLPANAVQGALAETLNPGRMERFTLERDGRLVEVLIDGAHNEAGAHALRRHLAVLDWAGFDLITGFQADKDWPRIVEQWVPLAARGWGVPLRSPRGLDPTRMEATFGIVPFRSMAHVAAAFEGALAAGAERIVVAGSLWLVGEARAWLTGEPMEEIRGSQ